MGRGRSSPQRLVRGSHTCLEGARMRAGFMVGRTTKKIDISYLGGSGFFPCTCSLWVRSWGFDGTRKLWNTSQASGVRSLMDDGFCLLIVVFSLAHVRPTYLTLLLLLHFTTYPHFSTTKNSHREGNIPRIKTRHTHALYDPTSRGKPHAHTTSYSSLQ
ncbi:uncharacterized protein IWZ02DRAFT_465550 [Phyllosticta citriasiana]|uniref:uncharacterized protein n=1 Tax=Phyllosticta citriasiana TaxID=595635 RepID=UPI0030FDB11E